MKTTIRSLLVGATAMLAATAVAADNNPQINVAGNYRMLAANGFADNVNPLPVTIADMLSEIPDKKKCSAIARRLTADRWGEKIIGSLAGRGVTSPDSLARNFIVMTYRHDRTIYTSGRNSGSDKVTETYYAIFHVDVTAEQIAAIGRSAASARTMEFPVSVATFGKVKPGKTITRLARELPVMASRGTITSDSPSRIDLGTNAGLRRGDLVTIYAPSAGTPRRLARARVCDVWDNGSRVVFEDGKASSTQPGLYVERTPDSPVRFGFDFAYAPSVFGLEAIVDVRLGMSAGALGHHLLGNLGFALTDKPGKTHEVYGRPGTSTAGQLDYSFKEPKFVTAGIGYGLSATFGGRFGVMPYVMARYEATLFKVSDVNPKIVAPGQVPRTSFSGSALRVPIGVRLSYNLSYPLKLFVEGGYSFCSPIGDDYGDIENIMSTGGRTLHGDRLFAKIGLIF